MEHSLLTCLNSACSIIHIQQLSSANLNYVVISGRDGIIKIWQLNGAIDLQPLCNLTGHKNSVYQTLEVTSIPDTLASASADDTIRLWSISKF